jgi:DNA processing protein dprA, putative
VPLPDNAVTRVLQSEGATQINDLARLSDLSVREVMAVLFDLEMDGLVTTLPGGVYKLV